MRTLAEIGALGPFGMRRRQALWQVEKLFRPAGPLLEQIDEVEEASPLPAMSVEERLIADYSGTGLTLGDHPLALKRKELGSSGVVHADADHPFLIALADRQKDRVGSDSRMSLSGR